MIPESNIKQYIKILTAYGKACRLKIKFKSALKWDGAFCEKRMAIEVDTLQSLGNQLATLAHELGHYVDYTKNPNTYKGIKAKIAEKKDNKGKPVTPLQKKFLMQREVNAWNEAESLLKQLRIPVKGWFFKYRKWGLLAYARIKITE